MAVDIESLSAEEFNLLLQYKGDFPEGSEYEHLRMSREDFAMLFGAQGDGEVDSEVAEAQAQEPPQAPAPRTDLPKPNHMSDEEYQQFLAELAELPPVSWIGADGTLYMTIIPIEMRGEQLVSGWVALPLGHELRDKYAGEVMRYYDFQQQGGTDAQASDDDPA